jgi:uncharacterized protein (TIGR02246 family)
MSTKKLFSLSALLAMILGMNYLPIGASEQQDAGSSKPKDDRDADRTAIRQATQEMAQAFASGAAAKAAAFLTSEAELIPHEGASLRGRDAIQKAYEQLLAKSPKRKLSLVDENLRFTSRDTALQEGRMTVSFENGTTTKQRYSFLHVREDGKWLVALIREWPADSEDIRDLDWLVGSWEAKRGDVEMKITYEWFGNKAFLRGLITVRNKDRTTNAVQVIGKDPRTGDLRVWIFEHDGGFAEGTCLRDAQSWVMETEGVLADGGIWSARNVLLRVNQDTITWQTVYRTLGDVQHKDLPPVKISRVKTTR